MINVRILEIEHVENDERGAIYICSILMILKSTMLTEVFCIIININTHSSILGHLSLEKDLEAGNL